MYTATKDEDISNLKNTTSNIRNAASSTIDDVRSEVKSAAKNSSRKVLDLVKSAGNELSHASESVTSQIRSNPVKSSFIALGAGFLLGALLRR